MPVAANPDSRVVRRWLVAVAALVLATVLVGGATRLTESGLSIVEWRPVTGTLPPLSREAWQAEFEKYQAIPQYQAVNRGMRLEEFKTIYWWEWTHRLLARAVGVAFLLPFLWFQWRGWIDRALRVRLWAIFGLGALQGVVGWWMVASGLAERISVSQYRLAFHLTLACVIYAALIWVAQRLAQPSRQRKHLVIAGLDPAIHPFKDLQTRMDARVKPGHDDAAVSGATPLRIRASALALLAFVLVQIYLGALVAGLDAGLAYNSWPLIDGSLIPALDRLAFLTPAWRNLFENGLTVQFNHRMGAYLLWIVAMLHAVDAARTLRQSPASRGALLLAAAVTVQAAVGVVTLLQQAPIALALLHQGMAMVVLTAAVLHAARLGATVRRHRPATLSRAELELKQPVR